MKRDFLKALGLEEEAIEQIMKANGQDIAAEQAKIPSDYDQLKQQRDELLIQISQTGSATDTGEPVQDDRMNQKLQELDDLKAQLQRSIVETKVKEAFVKAGLTEDDYKDLIPAVTSENEEDALSRVEAVVKLVEAKTSATEKKVKESLLEDTPAPPGSGKSDKTEDSFAVKMAKKNGEKYKTDKE
ncbi:hypothetical protein LI142_08190 [Eubacterium limosum]|uniref:phage scaffolding protein n=1 Tax=Eubacterium limosum TaxID=1736 RepID=UPI001D06EFB2|nr:hypothetical protein [Eubacterium limosum]MCB6569478.1 hypothetical protein [Eubacterium limosum]